MTLYRLTLDITEKELESRLQNERDRKLTKAAVAAEGCNLIRDYGTVSSFVKIDRVIV